MLPEHVLCAVMFCNSCSMNFRANFLYFVGFIIGKMLQERHKLSFVQLCNMFLQRNRAVVELVSDNSRTGIIVIYVVDNII